MYANANTAASANAIPASPDFDVDRRPRDRQGHVDDRAREMIDQRPRVATSRCSRRSAM